MSLPSLLDYQQAVLHPEIAFPRDPELRAGKAAMTPLGTAAVASGGFAATFRIHSPGSGRSYAVRCFHKLTTDATLAQRYAQIAQFVTSNPQLDFLVDVRYDTNGVVVGGSSHPMVRMPWITGDPLGDWVDDHFDEPDAIEAVRRNLADAVRRLRAVHVAHGDLQHGNVMVGDDYAVTLIDYDGMYLRELEPYGAAERGHPNYQHPDRGSRFDENLDLFSAYVIDLSLAAIAQDPDLWDKFGGGGQNLLFSASDYADPGTSKVFDALLASPLAPRARVLKQACITSYEQIEDALSGKPTQSRTATATAAPTPTVMLASNAAALRRRQGDQVTIVGTVDSTKWLYKPHWSGAVALINFGSYVKGDFTVVAFGPVASALERLYGKGLYKLKGQTVTLTGLVTLYQAKRATNLTPQMVLSRAAQLKTLDAAAYATMMSAASGTTKVRTPPTIPRASSRTDTAATASAAPPPKPKPQARPAASPTGINDLLSTMSARFPVSPPPPSPAAPPKAPKPKREAPKPETPPPPRPTPGPATARPVPTRTEARPTVPPVSYPPPPPRYPPSYPPQWAQPPRRKRHRRVPTAFLLAIGAIWVVMLGLTARGCVATFDSSAPPPAPIRFQSASSNLSCLVVFESPASVRCDAGQVLYQPPPPPPNCAPEHFGRTVVLTEGHGAAFACATDSLIDPSLPVLEYNTTRTYGPFRCSIDYHSGVTCREANSSRGFRIERDSFEIY